MSAFRSAVYRGTLMHARRAPVEHHFTYPVCFFLFDLDELPALSARLRLFGHNRPAPVSLYDRDYGDGSGAPLAADLRRHAAAEGVRFDGGRILLLTQARMFGYVFNPVSFFYCYDAAGSPACVIAEVNNTFGDRHRYFLDARCRVAPGVYRSDKLLHVSPFFSLHADYDFAFAPERPDESAGAPLEVRMDVRERGEPKLRARLAGRRRLLTDGELLRTLVGYPLLTARIITAIHWQALRLYLKGAPFHHQPPYDPAAARRDHDREKLARAGGAAADRGPARPPLDEAPPGGALAPRPGDRPPARR